jgi:hypothetical protein
MGRRSGQDGDFAEHCGGVDVKCDICVTHKRGKTW